VQDSQSASLQKSVACGNPASDILFVVNKLSHKCLNCVYFIFFFNNWL